MDTDLEARARSLHAWDARIRVLEELDRARAELAEMEKHQARLRQMRNDAIVERSKLIHHMMTVRCWKNEDDRLFVFADDLFSILDYRVTDATPAQVQP